MSCNQYIGVACILVIGLTSCGKQKTTDSGNIVKDVPGSTASTAGSPASSAPAAATSNVASSTSSTSSLSTDTGSTAAAAIGEGSSGGVGASTTSGIYNLETTVSAADCGTPSSLVEPTATEEIRVLSSSLPLIQAGYTSVNKDQDAAKFACQSHGFLDGSVVTINDSVIYQWDPRLNILTSFNATDVDPTVKRFHCSGKMKDICKTNTLWMFHRNMGPNLPQ